MMIDDLKTVDDFIKAVLAIDNERDMRLFVEAYLGFLQKKGVQNIEQVMRDDIGWCFGRGMTEERARM